MDLKLALPGFLTGVFACMLAHTLVAQEFRIETEVYRDGESDPISENLTLFSGNLVFDFLLAADRTRFPEEIVIYQSNEKRFVLLNTARQIKTEIIEGEVLKILAALQTSSMATGENKYLFQPSFDEHYDVASGWLTMESPQLTYRTRGHSPASNQLNRYYEFLNQFARLNATDPRRMPPFARLKLNAAIKKYGFIPDEVEMTLVPTLDPPADPIRLRSTHSLMWELSDKDQQRIESAKRYWMDFRQVSLAEFRGLQQTAEAENGETKRK